MIVPQCGMRLAQISTGLIVTLRPGITHWGGCRMNRKGFTLIELLIVVVIIGILAAIAIPKFANTKAKAYIASMKSGLRNLVTAEEAYFADSVKYTATTACTTPPTAGAVNFCVTTGNNLGDVALAHSSHGWIVTITNNNLTTPLVKCAIFINTAVLAPAVSEGDRKCKRLNSIHANISYAGFCPKKRIYVHFHPRGRPGALQTSRIERSSLGLHRAD